VRFVCSLAFSKLSHLSALARACDQAGFAGVALPDHVVHPQRLRTPYPYTPDGKPRWEPFTDWPDPLVATASMAAVTSRLRFLTSIYVLPMRNPFLVAKAVATAAVLSGGRIDLGIGVGWMKDEFELLGQDFHTRGRRTDEAIEVLRKLWRGGWVEHHGRVYDFEPLEMSPAPPAEVPIYVGGISDAALRRAARLGDGWISDLHDTDELARIAQRLAEYRADSPRADRQLAILASCTDAYDLDGYRRLADLGVTHLQTMPWVFYGGGVGDLDAQLDGIARFADDILAKL